MKFQPSTCFPESGPYMLIQELQPSAIRLIPVFPLVIMGSVAYVKLVPNSGVLPASGTNETSVWQLPCSSFLVVICPECSFPVFLEVKMTPKLKFFLKCNYFPFSPCRIA